MSDTVPDLYRLAFMPGQFRCPKCGFQLSRQTLFVQSGTVGVSESDLQSEECPNDGTFMVHVTYREVVSDYSKRLDEEFSASDKLKAERDTLLATLRQVRLDVEAAPHAGDCEWNNPGPYGANPLLGKCDCFKSRILAEIDKALLSEQGSLAGETPQAKAELDVLAVPEAKQEKTKC